MVKFFLVIVLWSLFVLPAQAEEPVRRPQSRGLRPEGSLGVGGKDPSTAVMLAAIFPGAGHFYLGKIQEGLGYCTSEIAFALGGYLTQDTLKNSPPPEYHPLYILAMKEHELSIFTAYREAIRQSAGSDSTSAVTPVDDTSIAQLILAPFKPENIFNRDIYLFALGGGIISCGEWLWNKYAREEFTGEIDDVSKVKIGNYWFFREQGFALYEGMWLPVSLSAGVGEECCWRGVIQTEFERTFGRTRGWILASLFFGLGHLYVPHREDRYYKYYAAGWASLGGLYLGWLYQKDKYRLAKPIAAHFWFDFISGTVAFLLEPEKNPLQIKVKFNF